MKPKMNPRKTLSLLLAALMAAAVTGCGAADSVPSPTATPAATATPAPATPEESTPETGDTAEQPAPDAALSAIVDGIYEAHPTGIMMLETRAVDLSDASWAKYNTGLDSEQLAKVDAAVVSESMTGSIAYSLVVVRAKDAADAPALAEAMQKGINPGKWVCVVADAIRAVSYDDIAILVMANSEVVNPNDLIETLGQEFSYDSGLLKE